MDVCELLFATVLKNAIRSSANGHAGKTIERIVGRHHQVVVDDDDEEYCVDHCEYVNAIAVTSFVDIRFVYRTNETRYSGEYDEDGLMDLILPEVAKINRVKCRRKNIFDGTDE